MERRSRAQEDMVNAKGDQEKKTEALPKLLAALKVCSLLLAACCSCLRQLLLEGANALQQLQERSIAGVGLGVCPFLAIVLHTSEEK